jgi:hypothetical protein
MHVRACTRRPLVCLPPPARRRPPARGRPRWLHPAASCGEVPGTVDRVVGLLREVADLHRRAPGGATGDWASWYAHWLVEVSDLPLLLGTAPSAGELARLLVALAGEAAGAHRAEPWERRCARRIVAHFAR